MGPMAIVHWAKGKIQGEICLNDLAWFTKFRKIIVVLQHNVFLKRFWLRQKNIYTENIFKCILKSRIEIKGINKEYDA